MKVEDRISGNLVDGNRVNEKTLVQSTFFYAHYGNTGCGVFEGVTKLERFLPRNQHTQRKLLNF